MDLASRPRWSWPALAGITIAVVAALAYSNSVTKNFHGDDIHTGPSTQYRCHSTANLPEAKKGHADIRAWLHIRLRSGHRGSSREAIRPTCRI